MNDEQDRDQAPRTVMVGQFELGPLLMVMVVFAVAAGIAFYLVQGQFQSDPSRKLNSQFIFIMLTLAGPLSVMVVVSLIYSLMSWLGRFGK
jgi:hypothetical protein